MFPCKYIQPSFSSLYKIKFIIQYIYSAAHPVGSSIMILGGFGFLSRLHGLSIDNLVEVEMVLADGRIVIVSENEYPGTSACVHWSTIK